MLFRSLRSVEKGLKYSAANQPETNELMSKWLGATVAEVADQRSKINIFDIVKNKVVAFNRSSDLNLESSIRSGGRILLENGKIKQLGDATTLIDSSLIQSL